MKNRATTFFLSIFLFIDPLSADPIQNTSVIRAAIDIGMGGPKLQIAEVDPTTNKVVKLLHSQKYCINFYESISHSSDKRFSAAVMTQGLEAVKSAAAVAHSFQVDGIVAVATASFRSASNGLEFADRIHKETGIKVHIIDQKLEGRLAFQAALSKVDVPSEHLVVWDIGGGSIQFTGQDADGSYVVDCGNEGVGAFTDYIIATIQQHDTTKRTTPNPMSFEDIHRATIHARSLSQRVDKLFKEKMGHPHTQVVGVGSAFGCGIAATMKKEKFCLGDIAAVADSLAGKTDADFGGDKFAFCQGSHLLLALGYMQGLGIGHIHILDVNNADGALVYKPFWEK